MLVESLYLVIIALLLLYNCIIVLYGKPVRHASCFLLLACCFLLFVLLLDSSGVVVLHGRRATLLAVCQRCFHRETRQVSIRTINVMLYSYFSTMAMPSFCGNFTVKYKGDSDPKSTVNGGGYIFCRFCTACAVHSSVLEIKQAHSAQCMSAGK